MPFRDRQDRNAYMRRYHAGPGGEKQRDRVRRAKAANRDRSRRIINEAKDVPCLDCGGRFDPVCMDFDHVRGPKIFDIGRAGRRALQMRTLLAEMAKCEVVCANCHRIRTKNRREADAPSTVGPADCSDPTLW